MGQSWLCLVQQWKDNKPVTILTTIDSPSEHGFVERNVKVDGVWGKANVKRPKGIDTYNKYMNGVNRSDQILGKNSTLRKCMRWWKTLFFHMVDIAVANSFILFQLYRKEHGDIEELQRPKGYSAAHYRELARDLGDLPEYGVPPVYRPPKKELADFETAHIPKVSDAKRNFGRGSERVKPIF